MAAPSDRIAVVTGASRGIGRAAALALAASGAHVVAVARSVEGLELLDDEIQSGGGSATLVPLDLRDWPAIDRLGAAIGERWGRLDALFANAGILGAVTPLAHLDPELWHETVDINLSANWHLIRSLDPLLRAAEAGRALFVTSGTAHKARPFWGVYAAAKAALEALVRTYAAELTPSRAKANLINPGPMRTRMRAQAMPGEDPLSLPPPEALAPDIVRMLSPDFAENGSLFDFANRKAA